jgi:hypothetical protein
MESPPTSKISCPANSPTDLPVYNPADDYILRNDIVRAIQTLEPPVSTRTPRASLPSIAGSSYRADELRAMKAQNNIEARRPPRTSPSPFDRANTGGRAGSPGKSKDEKDSKNSLIIGNGPLIVSTLIFGCK